jgi:hypothetical protein
MKFPKNAPTSGFLGAPTVSCEGNAGYSEIPNASGNTGRDPGFRHLNIILRLMVRSGFHNIYPGQAVPAHLQSLVSDSATYQELLLETPLL